MPKPHIPLEKLRSQVEACHACPLGDTRTNVVFGEGSSPARVMIIGEAPGKNEDLQGEPFVGAAGKFLNELLAVAGLERQDVFIANVLKCRPPSNRDPRVEEIEMCTPHLREQVRTIDPEVIVTLGNFATKFILKTEVGITGLHGKLQHAGKFKVLPVFHPAAALYDPKKRDLLKEDFATLGSILNSFDPIEYINTPRWQQQRLGLERIVVLMEKLGNPQNHIKFAHVAGTNGKGSTCAYLAQILQNAGYKTGLFTSPYIECFEERIRINGKNISKSDLYKVTLQVRDAASEIEQEMGEHPTEFELMTAVALLHFAQSKCDVAVIEVGLGGRLDSTNVISPEVSVITRIGLDHTDVLGDTLVKIAAEKSGIIKQDVPVVVYPQNKDVMQVIEKTAKKCKSQLYMPDFSSVELGNINSDGMRLFSYAKTDYETQLLATYQPYNAALAIETAKVLAKRGFSISASNIQAGIKAAKWQGRFEIAHQNPLFIIDGAHNPQGVYELRKSLDNLVRTLRENNKNNNNNFDAIFITGVLADKDYVGMLDALFGATDNLPALFNNATFFTYTPANPRALDSEELAKHISKHDKATLTSIKPTVRSCKTPEEATELAIKLASSANSQNTQIIVAFGTLYAIGQILVILRNK